jgi:hypothetical protein
MYHVGTWNSSLLSSHHTKMWSGKLLLRNFEISNLRITKIRAAGRLAELLISAYLLFAGKTRPFQPQGIHYRSWYIMCLKWLGMKHGWTDGTKKRWSRLFRQLFFFSCLVVWTFQKPVLEPYFKDYRLYSNSSLTLTFNEWRFNLGFSWVSILFSNSWCASSHRVRYDTNPPAIQKQRALTLKRSSDWTSTHWVWVCMSEF